MTRHPDSMVVACPDAPSPPVPGSQEDLRTCHGRTRSGRRCRRQCGESRLESQDYLTGTAEFFCFQHRLKNLFAPLLEPEKDLIFCHGLTSRGKRCRNRYGQLRPDRQEYLEGRRKFFCDHHNPESTPSKPKKTPTSTGLVGSIVNLPAKLKAHARHTGNGRSNVKEGLCKGTESTAKPSASAGALLLDPEPLNATRYASSLVSSRICLVHEDDEPESLPGVKIEPCSADESTGIDKVPHFEAAVKDDESIIKEEPVHCVQEESSIREKAHIREEPSIREKAYIKEEPCVEVERFMKQEPSLPERSNCKIEALDEDLFSNREISVEKDADACDKLTLVCAKARREPRCLSATESAIYRSMCELLGTSLLLVKGWDLIRKLCKAFFKDPSIKDKPGCIYAYCTIGKDKDMRQVMISDLASASDDAIKNMLNEVSVYGQTTVLVKIGRSENVPKRIKAWQKRCGQKVFLVQQYPAAGTQMVPNNHRVETLIHLELGSRREALDCVKCQHKHNEWFRVDANAEGFRLIDRVVRRWVSWSHQTFGICKA
ncbi:hypothetical protein ANO11243_000450 [Dothideomycetidae sp. 11243]|nr:hypothetical protein ANO11243_000450 [fungal sp. No.11243]